MRNSPRVGEVVEHRVTVTSEMTARLFDRQVHPVYGTAWMVRHVEEAGRLLVEPHLGPDEDATGYSISLTHHRPAAVGQRLTVTATATVVDDQRCVAEVTVEGEGGVVGTATFVQRYIRRGTLGGAR